MSVSTTSKLVSASVPKLVPTSNIPESPQLISEENLVPYKKEEEPVFGNKKGDKGDKGKKRKREKTKRKDSKRQKFIVATSEIAKRKGYTEKTNFFPGFKREKNQMNFKKKVPKQEMLKNTRPCRRVTFNPKTKEFTSCTYPHCTFAHTQEEYRFPPCRFDDNCFNCQACLYKHSNETRERYMERTGKRLPTLPSSVKNIVVAKPVVKRSKEETKTPFVWGSRDTSDNNPKNRFAPLEDDNFPDINRKLTIIEVTCKWNDIYLFMAKYAGNKVKIMLPPEVAVVIHPDGYLLDFNKVTEKQGATIINVKASKEALERFTNKSCVVDPTHTLSIFPKRVLPFIKKVYNDCEVSTCSV